MQRSKRNFKLIVSYLGTFLVMIGIIILLPLVVLPFYKNEYSEAYCFIVPGTLSIFVGYLVKYFFKGTEGKLENHEDIVLIISVWILAILISSVPFLLTGTYNFSQSIFEVTSGYSTTGLTVVNVETCSHIFLLYRSIILFVGGVGLVLVLTCAISDRYGLRLYYAEGHSDKLMPNLAKSARLIISIYGGYIIGGTVFYMIFGMDAFDAFNHSIAAVSTGGFSTKAASIGAYNSFPIELVTLILMILGQTNFVIHLYLLKGKFKNVIKHCEIKFCLIIIAVFTLLGLGILMNANFTFLDAFRVSFFQIVSCLSTTGFQNVETFKSLPCSFVFIMILLMLCGGGLGSTAGGIKQYRICVAIKGCFYNITERLASRKIITTHFIDKAGTKVVLDDDEIKENSIFVIIYLMVFFIGSFIFTCFGYSITDSMFEFASSLGTVGLSMGITGYNAHPVILWTSTVGMFLGRLEILPVFTFLVKTLKIKH